jgi:antitoxin CcdA
MYGFHVLLINMATTNKVSCNTSIDAALIKEARALNLSPSAILEEALCKAVKVAKYERWCQDNKQAITEHNRKIDQQGTFSEKIGQL